VRLTGLAVADLHNTVQVCQTIAAMSVALGDQFGLIAHSVISPLLSLTRTTKQVLYINLDER